MPLIERKIFVSVQMGCSTSDMIVSPIHDQLIVSFRQHLNGSYFKTLEYFSIFLRISGALSDFGSEGAERLRYVKTRGYINIDLVVPECRWRDVETNELREYLALGAEQCFERLVTRARKADELADEPALRADFEAAMVEFRNAPND